VARCSVLGVGGLMITASDLYDYVTCPQRVYLDHFGDTQLRDSISPFVHLLWERGSAYEQQVIGGLGPEEYVSLKELPPEAKEVETLNALRAGVPLIYGGRISADGLVGEPDLDAFDVASCVGIHVLCTCHRPGAR